MSMERTEIEIQGFCPVCSALVAPGLHPERSEILPCPECQSMLVVESREGGRLILAEAPRIEEDWGE